MTPRERLQASLRGRPVDRPPVSFYELDGLGQDPHDSDPFNVFSHPSWKPLLDLTWERTDCIHRRGVPFKNQPPDPVAELTTREVTIDEHGSRHTHLTIRAGDRVLTKHTRRDPDVDTVWTTEPLLKGADDFKAWLALPQPALGGEPDVDGFLEAEERLGDHGIMMIDTGDPICAIAPLFDMGEFTVVALTEPALFRRALDRAARVIHWRTEQIARALPGYLWRICGPEYASPPYLPPALFEEYVVRYDTPMVESIQRHGGHARIHSHGRLRGILDHIASTGCSGLDPIEPPHQGDVTLRYVREKVGQQMTLFGNLEVSDIENLPTDRFREKVATALREGTEGPGRGFVLMPSACPYGRILPAQTLRNYECMVEMAEAC